MAADEAMAATLQNALFLEQVRGRRSGSGSGSGDGSGSACAFAATPASEPSLRSRTGQPAHCAASHCILALPLLLPLLLCFRPLHSASACPSICPWFSSSDCPSAPPYRLQVRADPELAAYILRDPRGAAAMGLPVHLILPALQAQQAAARGGGRGGGGGAPWYADSDDAAMARAGRGATPTHSSAGSRSGGADSVSGGPASGAAHAPSSSWMTGMQRRLNAMAARFRRNNNAAGGPEGASGAVAPAPGSTAARVEPVPGAGAAARPAVPSAGGSWFSGRRSGYLGLPGPAGDAAAAHASSSDGAPPGGVGSDGSRSGRRSYGGGGGASLGAEAGDIELTEAAPPAAIAAALAPGSGSKAGVAGSLNGAAGRPVGVGAPGGAAAAGAPGAVNPHPFAIDDEEDEEEPEGDESETRALTLARGTRHV